MEGENQRAGWVMSAGAPSQPTRTVAPPLITLPEGTSINWGPDLAESGQFTISNPLNGRATAPALSDGKEGPSDDANGDLKASVLRRRTVGATGPSERGAFAINVPAWRVLVEFNVGRFVSSMMYHMFYPLSLPFFIAREGRIAARNMSMFASPFTVGGFLSWCVLPVFTFYHSLT